MPRGKSFVSYRNIPGFPGYRAGDDGSIWTGWKLIGRGPGNGRGCKSIIGRKWKRLKPTLAKFGYHVVSVKSADGKMRVAKVHRLVLLAFVGPCPPGHQCCHFPDPSKTNNNLHNLRWGTAGDNAWDRTIHTGHTKGENNPKAKITESVVRRIRSEYATGRTTQLALGKKYGLSESGVAHIVHGRCWKYTK